MEVVLLCGGRGERMQEYTKKIPKPMVPIGGRPMIWHVMQMYSQAGCKNFTLCLGYKGEVIRDYFIKNSNSSSVSDATEVFKYGDWTVRLASTGITTMTGGRLKRVEPYIEGENLLVSYADAVSDVNLSSVIEFHERQERQGTVTLVRQPPRFGVVRLEGERVTHFAEKHAENEPWISGGFFVFSREVFKYLIDDETVLEEEPLSTMASIGELSGFQHDGFWQCMDTAYEVAKMNTAWKKEDHPWIRREIN
ncbi:sugar phosphate nucleotidyltransferase [Streptomyces sp. NPDC058286]|uniref:sugar phosphate nucleotidyltransferase n=1 Tax=Streptomyces sp. NPDC058286 TaxID=3346422 RepID=UPI0036ECE045